MMDGLAPTFVVKNQRRSCIVKLQRENRITGIGLSIDPNSMVSNETTYTIVKQNQQRNTIKSKVGADRLFIKTKTSEIEPKLIRNKDKNVDYLQRTLARNMEVWYNMQNLKNYISRLKSAYICDIEKCDGLRSRLHRHLMDYHPEVFDPDRAKGGEAQTNFTLGSGEVVNGSAHTTEIPLPVLREAYKPKLEERLRKWMKKLPFDPKESPLAKKVRENHLNNLVDKIAERMITGKAGEYDFEGAVKEEIDKFLDKINMWYTGSKRDVAQYKDGLREHLYKKLADDYANFYDEVALANEMGERRNTLGPTSFIPIGSPMPKNEKYMPYTPRHSFGHTQQSHEQGRHDAQNNSPSRYGANLFQNGAPKRTVDQYGSDSDINKTYKTVEALTKNLGGKKRATSAYGKQKFEHGQRFAQGPTASGNDNYGPNQTLRHRLGGNPGVSQNYGPNNNNFGHHYNGLSNNKNYAPNHRHYTQGYEPNAIVNVKREPEDNSYGPNFNVNKSFGAGKNFSQNYQDKPFPKYENNPNIPQDFTSTRNDETFAPNMNVKQNYEPNETFNQNYVPSTNKTFGVGNGASMNATQGYDPTRNEVFNEMYANGTRESDPNILQPGQYGKNTNDPNAISVTIGPETDGGSVYAANGNNSAFENSGAHGPTMNRNEHESYGMRGNGANAGYGMRGNGANADYGMRGNGANADYGVRGNGANGGYSMRGNVANADYGMRGNGANADKYGVNHNPKDNINNIKDTNENRNSIYKSDSDYEPIENEGVSCENEDNEYYYDGPDLLGNYRRKIDRKRRSPNNTLSDPTIKNVVPSSKLCACSEKAKEKKKSSCGEPKFIDLEQEVREWLKNLTLLKDNGLADKKEIIDTLMFHLWPYLKQPSESLNKAVLKSKIVNILDSLGLCTSTTGSVKSQILKFAGDLSNRLIGIQSRLECTGGTSWKCNIISKRPFRDIELVRIGPNDVLKNDLRHDLNREVKDCLLDTKLAHNRNVEEDITDVLLQRIELIRSGIAELVSKEIKAILNHTDELSELEAVYVTENIIQNAKDVLIIINNINNRTQMNITTSGTLSIYTSEHDMTPSFAAPKSTPKKNKDVEKLSPAEIAYTDKLAKVVKDWLETAPTSYKAAFNKDMTDTMVYDLAGEIADHVKLTQLAPDPNTDKRSFMTVYIYKWLLKYNMINDIEEAEPHTQELVNTMTKIDTPNLMKPQHGSRQVMKNLQHMESDKGWAEPFVPEAKDIIEDEISIWMNEQPSAYAIDNKDKQNEMIHDFAKKIQPKLASKKNKEVEKEVKNWVKKIIKSKEKDNIESLTNSLLDRIHKLPQDETIAAKKDNKLQQRNEVAQPDSTIADKSKMESADCDRTMKRFILKYIERNSDTDDPLVQRALGQLLKSELLKLNSTAQREVYENVDTAKQIERFCPEKLNKEMGYIKDVSDWLKNIPIDGSYNTEGNKDRVEFVIGLAKNIVEVENERNVSPHAMDYNTYLGGIICQFMEQLPIIPDQRGNVTLMIDQLLTKIVARRNDVSRPVTTEADDSIPSIINVFIHIYGPDIADDELKLEIWTARLLKEVQKSLETDNITAANITSADKRESLPGKELIKRFQLELDYVTEITDWLKNLPIVGPVDVSMISDLAEKMAAHANKQVSDKDIEKDIAEFISKLPLDPQKAIDVSFVTQQLLHRKDIVNKESKDEKDAGEPATKGGKAEKPKSRRSSKLKRSSDPASMLVEIIDKWCDNLPIKGKEKKEIKQVKIDIASKLFQKIGDLNFDPSYASNDVSYKDALANEIDVQFTTIPENLKFDGNKEKLKLALLEDVLEARFLMKQSAAGDNYKQKLKDTLETSLPNPMPIQNENPGFELYKNHLTNMFILDNFDQGSYKNKLKYEKKIKGDIDAHFQDAQERNTVPIAKDQLYNHLYSSLYKVGVPTNIDLKKEVEKAKTKYEIEEWLEKLPIAPPSGKSELLDRDLKIDVLTDKLYQIEKEKGSPDKTIKEIMKWLSKLSQVENNADVEKNSRSLQETLKDTEKSRRSISKHSGSKKKSKEISLFTDEEGSDAKKETDDMGIWISPNAPSDFVKEQPVQKSGEMILDIVDQWCKNLPLPSCTNQNDINAIKDDFSTKLTMKISELNSHPHIFKENQLYDHLLGQEVLKLIETLMPRCKSVSQCKDALKDQLIAAINSVKPVIEEERERYEYKKDLEDEINRFLATSQLPTSAEAAVSADVKEDIMNDFIEYQYNQNDEEGKLFYKIKLLQAMLKYNMNTLQNKDLDEIRRDTIHKGNHLLYELLKIPTPGDQAMKDEVEEIRMKQVVNDYFNKMSLGKPEKNYLQSLLKNSLAKQLNDIEKSGYSKDNEDKMKLAITRATSRLRSDINEAEIDAFIKKIKDTENIRRAPPPRSKLTRNASSPAQLGRPCNTCKSFANPKQDIYDITCPQPSVGFIAAAQIPPQVEASPTKALRPLMMSQPTADAVEPWNLSQSGPQAVQQNVDYSVYHPPSNQPQQEDILVIPCPGDGQSIEVQLVDYGTGLQPHQMVTPSTQFPASIQPKEVVSVHTECPDADFGDIESVCPVSYTERSTSPTRRHKRNLPDEESESNESMRCLCEMYPDMFEREGSRRRSCFAPMMPFMAIPLPMPMQYPYLY